MLHTGQCSILVVLQDVLVCSLVGRCVFPCVWSHVYRGTLHCTGFVTPFFGHRIHVRRSVDSHDTPDLAPAAVAAAGAQSPTAAPGAPAAASVRRALPTASGNIEEWVERVYGDDQETTYNYQLQRFVEDVSVSKGYCTDR